MSGSRKRTVRFAEGSTGRDDEEGPGDAISLSMSRAKYSRLEAEAAAEGEAARRKTEGSEETSKHTLDSDEEEEDKYEKLDIRKVEGQEDATQEYEGMTRITPFNMTDEMEDGHFDSTGNFIFKKGGGDVKDAWLDNIDWARVKKDAGSQWQQTDEGDDSKPRDMADSELKQIYDDLLAVLHPQETIAAALRRLANGAQRLSTAEERKRRWAAKKAGTAIANDPSLEQVASLTALADALISRGDMEAYQLSREKVKILRDQMDHRAVDDLDMFGDPVASSSHVATGGNTTNTVDSTKNDVQWEYRLQNEDAADIHGPASSQEMMKLQDDGAFDKGAWARRIGTTAFYTVARIDFELFV